MHVFSSNFAGDCVKATPHKIMPDNPYIHPMWTGSNIKERMETSALFAFGYEINRKTDCFCGRS